MTEEIWAFLRFPKAVSDGADATFTGRVFQSLAAATGKARSSMVERRVRRTTSDVEEADGMP